jgi:hypothetical protein
MKREKDWKAKFMRASVVRLPLDLFAEGQRLQVKRQKSKSNKEAVTT